MNTPLIRVGRLVTTPVVGAVRWIHSFLGRTNAVSIPESIEMEPVTFQRSNFARVSFEELQDADERLKLLERSRKKALDEPDSAAAAVGMSALVVRAAMAVLALPLARQLLQRAHAAAQAFLFERTCHRIKRLAWIGWATLLWGMLLTFISSCGVVLALTGDLEKVLDELTGTWFARFGIYLMPFFAAVHVAQVVGGVLLLLAIKMAKTSPPHPRDPTKGEFLLCVFSTLGIAITTISQSSSETIIAPSPRTSLPQGRAPSVLQVEAQIEHNPDGQKPTPVFSPTKSTLSTELPQSGNVRLSTNMPLTGTSTGRSSAPTISQIPQTNTNNQLSLETPLPQTFNEQQVRTTAQSLNVVENQSQPDNAPRQVKEETLARLSSTHIQKIPITATASASLSPEATKNLPEFLLPSSGKSPTMNRAIPTGAPKGRSILVSSLEEAGGLLQSIVNLRDEDAARTRKAMHAPKTDTRLLTPWLWASAATLATYTAITAALYSDGSVTIPATLTSAIAMATPCILDVLAELLGVSENCDCEDIDRLFNNTDLSYESIETSLKTSFVVTTTQSENMGQDDNSPVSHVSEFNEKTSLLRHE